MCATNRSSRVEARLSGTALFYTLLITTLIGIVLTALLSIWMYFRASHQKDLAVWQQLTDLESGFLYVQSLEGDAVDDLFPYATDSIKLLRYRWGVFDLVHSSAHGGTQINPAKTALLGRHSNIGPTLEMLDTRKPLALSGRSQIRGNVRVPGRGITTTTVNGKPFQGGTALIGRNLPEDGQTPALERRFLDQLTPPADAVRLSLPDLPDSLKVSFTEPPIILTGHHIDLRNKNWRGPIYCLADSLITVHRNSQLDGLILDAPQVQIDTAFEGRIQVFATKEISLGPNTKLGYPSVLAIVPKGNAFRQSGRIRLDQACEIAGFIIGLKQETARESQLLASLTNIDFKGRIFWQGGLEASGKIKGAVYCDNFFYRGTGGQFYFNYLVDCIIDGPSRSKHWVEPAIWGNGQKAIVQWLD